MRIAETLTRLIAPILSFTADEIWEQLPAVAGREASVHLALFPDLAEIVPGNEDALEADWAKLLALREKVLARLEVLRAEKVIGKSLEARVKICVRREDAWLPSAYVGALPELFNVSEVELVSVDGSHDDNSMEAIAVERSNRPKCERCWRYVPDVGSDERFPSVCLRCADALAAIGYEPRGIGGAA